MSDFRNYKAQTPPDRTAWGGWHPGLGGRNERPDSVWARLLEAEAGHRQEESDRQNQKRRTEQQYVGRVEKRAIAMQRLAVVSLLIALGVTLGAIAFVYFSVVANGCSL